MVHLKPSQLKFYFTSALISSVLLATFLLYHYHDENTTPYGAYDPLTFKNRQQDKKSKSENSPNPPMDDRTSMMTPLNSLIKDEPLHQIMHNDLNNQCPIFTFFNDWKIKKLTKEEQQYHKTMLKKWILLYNSLGFNVSVLDYNDALDNSRMQRLAVKGLLVDKDNQIKENYLKLLAWEKGGSDSKFTGSLYSEYTIFPTIKERSLLTDLKYQCNEFKNFTMFEEFNFDLMMSNHDSISHILENLESGDKDFQIYETSRFNNLFASYSIPTFQKLFNSNYLKKVVERIPEILDSHLRNNRILNRFESIQIVDPISIADHYFARSLLEGLKSIIKCENSLYPPPTMSYLRRFETEILQKLPERVTVESGLQYGRNNDALLEELLTRQNTQSGKCSRDLPVTISNVLQQESKVLNLVAFPHPVSTVSSLHVNDKRIITNEDILDSNDRPDFISKELLVKQKGQKSYQNLIDIVKSKSRNTFFFNAELMNVENIRNQLSILLGVEISPTKQTFTLEFTDNSKSLNEIIGEEFMLSQGEFTRKLDRVKHLVQSYELPMPFDINQRQSPERLKKLRKELAEMKKNKDTQLDPERVLRSQKFESRHDPVIEISENWNPQDTSLWYLIKNLRYIDQVEFDYWASI